MATVTAVTKAALQAQLEALRHNCNLVETERDALRVKLDARNQDLVGLNEAYSSLSARLDAAEQLIRTLRAENNAVHTQQRPSRSAAAQISERRAAMQRAREEAMATGRYVKV